MKFSRSLLMIVAALAPVACHSKKENASESLLPVAVRTVVVENKARPSSEEVVGTVRAKLRAAIEPKVSARIETLLVAPGQMVKAGDLIAQLDPREIQAKLDQALALREQATRDLARSRELLDKKITTQADFDAVQARARVAEGAAREMETMLGYTKVVAPFDGIVTRKLADVGDLAAPGKPIIEMEDPRALRFEADVPEALIGHVKLGAKLPVQVAEGAAPIEGTVVEVAPVADAASRTFLVKLDLPAAGRHAQWPVRASLGADRREQIDPRAHVGDRGARTNGVRLRRREPTRATPHRPHRQAHRRRSRNSRPGSVPASA